MDRPEKPRMVEIELDQEQKKHTPIALDLLELKNAKTHHVLTLFLEKNGNAKVSALCLNKIHV